MLRCCERRSWKMRSTLQAGPQRAEEFRRPQPRNFGRHRLEVDIARDQVRATVVQASRQLEAARASQPQVTAAEVAFKGVRQGARAAFVRSGSIRSASPHLYAGVKSYSREAKDYDA
jgi:hypothetical protein